MKNVLGGNAAVGTDGKLTMTNIGGTGQNTVDAAISNVKNTVAAAKTEVTAGNNVRLETTTAADGHTQYKVNAKNATASAGSTAVTVVAGTEANDTTNYAVDLSAATKASIAKADTAIQSVTSKDANLTATTTNGAVTLDFADAPTFAGTVTSAAGFTVTGGPSMTTAGINAGNKPITNVASGGTTLTNAANIGDVQNAVNASTLHYLSVNDGGTQGSNYDNKGATGSGAVAIGKNSAAATANSIALGIGTISGSGSEGSSIAIGANAAARNQDAIAFGTNTKTYNRAGVAVGKASTTYGNEAIAIGNQALTGLFAKDASGNVIRDANGNPQTPTATRADNAVALGNGAMAEQQDSLAMGTQANTTGANGVAIGKMSSASTSAIAMGLATKATANDTIAMGRDAAASAVNAIAIGQAAKATKADAVVLGNGSNDTADATKVASATVGGITYGGFAGATPAVGDQVSVGSDTKKR